MSSSNKAYPGKLLGALSDLKPMGTNVYVYNDKIFSAVKGTIVYDKDTVEVLTADTNGNLEAAMIKSDANAAE